MVAMHLEERVSDKKLRYATTQFISQLTRSGCGQGWAQNGTAGRPSRTRHDVHCCNETMTLGKGTTAIESMRTKKAMRSSGDDRYRCH